MDQPTIIGMEAICNVDFLPQLSIRTPLRREPRGVAAEWMLAEKRINIEFNKIIFNKQKITKLLASFNIYPVALVI